MEKVKIYSFIVFQIIINLFSTNVFAENIFVEDKKKIVVTTTMIGDFVKNIIKDDLDLEIIISSGIDPHLYKPTRSDILKMSEADLVLYHGLTLEGRMLDAFDKLSKASKRVVPVAEILMKSKLGNDFTPHIDPHIWMDPSLWMNALTIIADEIIKLDPGREVTYKERRDSYLEQLKLLDSESDAILKTVPSQQRVLITAHDAFHYFGKRYGFIVEGIQGISTDSEAGVRDIERLVDLIVSKKIKAVFTETTVSEKNISALVNGAKSKNEKVLIGDSLYSDSMGQKGTEEATYIGMFRYNVRTITKFLKSENAN